MNQTRPEFVSQIHRRAERHALIFVGTKQMVLSLGWAISRPLGLNMFNSGWLRMAESVMISQFARLVFWTREEEGRRLNSGYFSA